MSFDSLSGYTPEVPKSGGFEAFKYEGPCKVNYSRIEPAKEASPFYGTQAGANVLSIEVEVLEGDFKGRKLWKKFHIDSTVADKKGKTQLQKLADQFITMGLTFCDMSSLVTANATFANSTILVKAYGAKFPGEDEKKQIWNIKGLAEKEVPTSSLGAPSF